MAGRPASQDPAPLLSKLGSLVERAERDGVASLSLEELEHFPRLYRHASSVVARLATSAHDPAALEKSRRLLARAHGLLYRELSEQRDNALVRAARFLVRDSPRAIRAEWKLLAFCLGLFYGLTALSFFAVRHDLELAFVLQPSSMVAHEIEQLRETETGQPFRGNFTFGFGMSPGISGWILAHNISVSVLFFGSGLIPPLFLWLLASNALMVGTYMGVATHWGQGFEISSILWCHGVIELEMIVLAGAAGLVLLRAWIAPGPWSRSHAMRLESRRAWALLAPVFPFLFLSGLIEGFVSPHAPTAVRGATAIASALLLVAWACLGGRGAKREPAL